eukprot:gene59536-79439_t
MGGYGLYVWGSLGMCAATVVAELMVIRFRRRLLAQEAGAHRMSNRMKPRNRRLVALTVGLATLAAATALVLNAFNSNLVFFFSPTQVMANEAPRERAFRVGGLVEQGSVVREPQGLTIRFMVTDT